MKELVIACCRVAQKDPHKLVDEQDKEYWRWRDVILLSEDVMLEAICFDLSLEPPYKTLFEQLVFFGEGDNNRLRNAAWAFVNDSYLTMLCLLFPSRTIATSALYAAAKHCGVSFPDDEQGRPWWHIIGVDLEEIRRACNYMASVYEGTASKGGKEGGMYERTSELGDGRGDKTRIAGPTGEGFQSPAGGIVNGSAASPVTVEAGGKRTFEERAEPLSEPTTNGASHQLDSDLPLQDGNADRRKRQRMADDTAPSDASTGPPDGAINATVLHDGNTSRDPHSSSIPSQLNGIYVHESGLSDSGGLVSPKLDDVSEEGEVEA